MAGPVAAVQGEAAKVVPRNSSIDSAISAMSSKSNAQSTSEERKGAIEIANLIRTAGTPEAVIQHLLKEKHSLSQQNGQLWRLVDKQRGMLHGLNKDLEKALKDKEKYRNKLKEMMADPAVSRAAGVEQSRSVADDRVEARTQRLVTSPSLERIVAAPPDSPTLDSDSQKNSPIDATHAPYPITPPADQPNGSPTTATQTIAQRRISSKALKKAALMSSQQGDEAAEHSGKGRKTEPLKDISPYSPPSISLPSPSDPPKMPPPKPPVAPPSSPPTFAVIEASPQPDAGLTQFPAPPPRKPPPAPLNLSKGKASAQLSREEEEDSESDYDDILEVEHILTDKRGRRRTREEDDREREVIAFQEAEARSASKKSNKSGKGSRAPESESTSTSNVVAIPPPLQQDMGGLMPMDAIITGQEPKDRLAPLLSPGLPASPRPMAHMGVGSPPLSPRTIGSFPAAPLSPRPPRQPIPLPPNTALAASDSLPSPRPLNIPKKTEIPQAADAADQRPAPRGRTGIYKGFMSEEYPDLLLPPNALPSVEIRVASSRMKPSRASLISLTQLEEDPVFTLAVLSRSDGSELWRVEKDPASLAKLDQRLKQCAAFTARTPDRSLFSGHAPAKLDARRIALEMYLDELLDTPLDLLTALELCKYLSTTTLPPNADEVGSSVPASRGGSVHRIGPDGRPIRHGYLTKRGKNFGGWKARFFVTEGPHLKYYEMPGGAHLGTIKLQNAQIGKQSPSHDNQSPSRGMNAEELDDQYRHAFVIFEPKKKDSSSHVKHVLCAENDRERDLWVDALLQWIDYRDPDDADSPISKPNAHDRHTSGSSEMQSAGKSKKGGQPSVRHQVGDSDALVGVRYDSTAAGETPQGVPGRPRPPTGPSDLPSPNPFNGESMVPQASKLISGPKDGQVIQDTAAWGNRTGLTVATDDKKQKKRSFFGFGPKTRSSSEGQEGAFGEGGSVSTSAPNSSQNSHHGPVRQVFGATLAEAVRYCPPVDVNVPLPSVVYRCIQYLDETNAVLEEGIFRLSGSNVLIKQLKERFNTEGDVDLVTDEHNYDIHAVASLLKLYLRELPSTILTRDLHLEFLAVTEMPDRTEKLAALNLLAQRLPQANATLLKYLIAFLIKIINNADLNRMTVRNVGIVFSPTLNVPAPVFALLLQNYEAIFGIDPDDYELPSPISEPEGFGRFDPPPTALDPPTRPSTSSGSGSPHRQQLMDSIREYQRSTPTPPLMMSHSAARGSPTPSVGTRQAYEPSYVPGGRSGPDLGFDAQGYQLSGRPGKGYEMPTQQGAGEEHFYEQSAPPASRRRESAVYMGGLVGLQHQGSRSRLREETRY